MDPNIKLAPNPDNNELNHSNSYAKLLGCLQFISNSTRLDISYAVNKLATYTANLGLQHHGAIKWILRYLAGMKTLGITYQNTPDETDINNLFHSYADAAFTNADDQQYLSNILTQCYPIIPILLQQYLRNILAFLFHTFLDIHYL